MTHAPLTLLSVLSLAAAGCGGVKVYPTGASVAAAPRPADCAVEFLFQPPSPPFDALADLQSHVTAVPPGGAWLALRPKACELGADAVIVTRDQVLNYLGHTMVEGTAIKFRPTAVAAPPPPELVPAPPAPAAAPAPAPAPPPEPRPAS